MEKLVFGGQRLLDLDNHIAGPYFGCTVDNSGPCGPVFLIGNHAAESGAFLHEYLVSRLLERVDSRRGDACTKFLCFDFSGDADFHNPDSFVWEMSAS